MRIALCLYGLTGSVDFCMGLGKPIDPRIGHHFHKKNIIDVNDNVDVFFHTWNVEFEKMLVDLYKPKEYVTEKQILFNPDSVGKNSIPSRWYSTNMVINLKKHYEEKHNFKYDFVMIYRFDHIFLNKLIFNDLDNEYIYFRHTNGMRAPANFSHGREETENCKCYGKRGGYGIRLFDAFTIANSENMDKFGSLYEYHQSNETDFLDPHDECYVQLERHNLQDKLRFAYFGYDPHQSKNIMDCEIMRAVFEDPSYDETKPFDINNFVMITDNLTSNPIVQQRFPGWAGWGKVDKPELKKQVGFKSTAVIGN